MMPAIDNLVAYCVQLAVLVAAAWAITAVLRLRVPRAALYFWQAVLAAAILLPLLQPRAASSVITFSSSPTGASAGATIADLTPRSVDIASWLLMLAMIGIALRLTWLAAGFIRLRRIVAGATPAAALQPLAHALSESIRATAAVTFSDDVQTPATIGVRRPLILLPRRILEMPQPIQRAVIAHELVHVRRRDWLHTMFEELWCAMLWFHPAARLLANRLSMSREMVVDETTLLLTRDRRAYAEALLAFSTPQPHPGAPTTRIWRRGVDLPGVTPLIGRRHLSQRISLIAQEEAMPRHRLLASLGIALFVAGAATASAVSVVPMNLATGQNTKVYKPGNGVSLPVVTKEAKAEYTREAMARGIQGSVFMAIVVLESGDVGDVRVTRSLDAEYGLDNEAVKAMKQWQFRPGMKDGEPVAVEVQIEMSFRLK